MHSQLITALADLALSNLLAHFAKSSLSFSFSRLAFLPHCRRYRLSFPSFPLSLSPSPLQRFTFWFIIFLFISNFLFLAVLILKWTLYHHRSPLQLIDISMKASLDLAITNSIVKVRFKASPKVGLLCQWRMAQDQHIKYRAHWLSSILHSNYLQLALNNWL